MEIFEQRLKQLMKEHKVTKYKISQETGASKQTVSNWYNGKSEPTVKFLYKLAVYFDVTSDYLIGLENERGERS